MIQANKTTSISLVLAVSFLFFHWPESNAGEITIHNQPLTISPSPLYDFKQKIADGIMLLKKTGPLAKEYKITVLKNGRKIKTSALLRKEIALAILDLATGAVFEKRIWVREDDIKNYPQTKTLSVAPVRRAVEAGPPADGLPVGELAIQPRWWNSFNTDYEIKDRPELAVIANKYLLESRFLTSLPEKSKDQYSEIIYTPYSLALHRPEIIAAGQNYLEANINAAWADLFAKQVMSFSDKTRLVTAGIGKEFVKNIILVEHIDPEAFATMVDDGRELTERVLAIIGTNQARAYRYTGSPAGANGLAQFIRPTYNTMVDKYPAAGLIKDYSLGMADHINAIKAMILFFDFHGADLKNKITRRDVVERLGISEEMLAAAYNGGPSRVVRSVNRYGLAWIDQQFNLPKTSRIFRPETLNYLKKFRSIRSLDLTN